MVQRPLIFEAMDGMSHGALKDYRRPNALDLERMLAAVGTQQAGGVGLTTFDTHRGANRRQASLANITPQTAIRPAAGAVRGKQQADQAIPDVPTARFNFLCVTQPHAVLPSG